jgi:hypothetical protein
MAFTQFTNLDFDQIRQSIKDYLRSNNNFTDFDFEGSNLSILIDTLAYNTYVVSYNQNAVANEAFLDSAVLRENVVSHARKIGYVPQSAKSSRAIVNIFVPLPISGISSSTPTVTLKAGLVAVGSASDLNYTFCIPQDVTVPVSNGYAEFDELVVYEGTYATKNFLVDNSQADQRYILPNAKIDVSTLVVKVSPTENDTVLQEYTKIDNIVGLTTTANKYLIQEVSGEKYEIVFGDGIIGKKLQNNNYIRTSYIITNGKSANGVKNLSFIGILLDNSSNFINPSTVTINTLDSSNNGADIESIKSIKNFAPRLYSSQFRAVSANDYEAIIPYIYPNAASVSAYGGEELSPPQYGKVYIVIKPKSGEVLSLYTKKEILNNLKKYSISGIVPEIIDMKYLYVELDSTIYYNPNFVTDIDNLQSDIINSLTTYSEETETNQFGGRVKYSKVVSLIDNVNVSITSNITKIKIRRNLNALIAKNAQYELCFGNKFHPKENGYSIKSTGFKISTNQNILYLSDMPNSDKKSGKIFFFYLDLIGTPVVVNPSAGIVNYETGEIFISAVNIVSTVKSDNVIEIEAIPESNDVIALKDLYINLNIGSSKFTLIKDIMSSGDNVAGTRFTTTSSFLNGSYTR